jgi:hypothetical protein
MPAVPVHRLEAVGTDPISRLSLLAVVIGVEVCAVRSGGR